MRVAERRAVNSFRERAPSFAAIAIGASVTARLEVSKLRGKSSLEVHHMEFRGQGGDDAEENLISFALDVTPACISPEKSTPNFRLRFLREEPYDTN